MKGRSFREGICFFIFSAEDKQLFTPTLAEQFTAADFWSGDLNHNLNPSSRWFEHLLQQAVLRSAQARNVDGIVTSHSVRSLVRLQCLKKPHTPVLRIPHHSVIFSARWMCHSALLFAVARARFSPPTKSSVRPGPNTATWGAPAQTRRHAAPSARRAQYHCPHRKKGCPVNRGGP